MEENTAEEYNSFRPLSLILFQVAADMFNEALKYLLKKACKESSDIWIASIGQIAEWWKEKQRFSTNIFSQTSGNYEIEINCTPRGTFLLKSKDPGIKKFFQDFSIIEGKRLVIKSPKRPVIGISADTSPYLKIFLENEGFIFEISDRKEGYSAYFDEYTEFTPEFCTKISSTNSSRLIFHN